MYFVILVLCECGEELNISIVSFSVHTLLLEHLHGIRVGLRLFEDRRAICKLLSRNLELGQPTTRRGAFEAILVQKCEEKPFKKSRFWRRSPPACVHRATRRRRSSRESIQGCDQVPTLLKLKFLRLVVQRVQTGSDQAEKCSGFFSVSTKEKVFRLRYKPERRNLNSIGDS